MKKVLSIILCLALIICILPICSTTYAATPNIQGQSYYYLSMSKALDDINKTTVGRYAIPERNASIAKLKVIPVKKGYEIYLLKNFTEPNVITVNTSKRILVQFENYVLRSNGVAFDIINGDLTFCAKGPGGIVALGPQKTRCVQLRSGSLYISGGTYRAKSFYDTACCFQSAGNLTVINAKMQAVYDNGQARCVTTVSGATTTLSKCDIEATARNGRAIAVHNAANCVAKLNVCNVRAYSNYQHIGNTAYGYCSIGVDNVGTIELNNCTVYGTHSGVQTQSLTSINGGKYYGYGHGGLYVGGVQNVARIRNAQFYCEAMPSGYTATIGCNNAALYIGGEGSESTRVFVNNCTFDAKTQPIVLRGSSGEKNNVLYISNSKLVSTKKIRIDSNHKVYLGIGNNFDATAANNPSKVTVTNNKYL